MKTIIFDFDGTLVDLAKTRIDYIAKLATTKVLASLAHEYQLALVTGSSREETLGIMKSLGWLKFFQKNLIITRDDIQWTKRTGRPFKMVRNKVSGEIFVIGDSISDVEGAKKANLPIIVIKRAKNISGQRRNFLSAVKKLFLLTSGF